MRLPLFSIVLLGGLLAAGRPALAQYDPTVAHRYVRPLELWPEVQGELALKNGDYLLLSLRGERSTTSYNLGASRSLGFDTRRVAAAYEHFWNEHWSGGGTLRYESSPRLETASYGDLLVPELLLRHRSSLFGGLTFGQRLGLEYQIPVNRHVLGGSGASGQFWGRLRVDVERLFSLGGELALRPRLSYAASTHLRLQKDPSDPDERTIQFTSLRGEVGVRLSQHVDVTPWVAYQTSYVVEIVQYQYDANNNQIPVRGGKANYVYPTLGLDLRFTLLPGGAIAQRQQLPTQH